MSRLQGKLAVFPTKLVWSFAIGCEAGRFSHRVIPVFSHTLSRTPLGQVSIFGTNSTSRRAQMARNMASGSSRNSRLQSIELRTHAIRPVDRSDTVFNRALHLRSEVR